MQVFRLYSTIKGFNKHLRYALAWNLLFCFGQGVYFLLNNLYLKEVVDDVSIGGIVGVYYLSYAIFSLLGGRVSDRLGSKKTILIGLVIMLVGSVGGALFEESTMLYLSSIITGIGHGFTMVIFVPLITEYSNAEEKKVIYNIAFATGTLFLFLGTLGGGFLPSFLQDYFDTTVKVGIRIAIIVGTLVGFFSFVPLLKVPSIKLVKGKIQKKTTKKKLSSLLLNYTTSKFFEGIGVGFILPFVNLFFAQRYNLNTSQVSFIIAIATLVTVGMMFYNTSLVEKLGEVKALIGFQAVTIFSMIIMSITMNVWLAVVFFLLFRMMYYSLSPITSKIIMDVADPSVKGTTNSIGVMFMTIGMSIASPIGRIIVEQSGQYVGYIINISISSLSLVLSMIFFYQIIKKRTVEITKGMIKSGYSA